MASAASPLAPALAAAQVGARQVADACMGFLDRVAVFSGWSASSRALAFSAWAARLSAATLFLVGLACVLPWISISVPAGGGLAGVPAQTQNFWVEGFVTVFGAFGSLVSNILVPCVGQGCVAGGPVDALSRGLAAGLALIVITVALAILAAVFASRAVRLMSGGRAVCCAACACECCGCCCGCACCGPPAVDVERRLGRARCSARAALALNALTAAAAAAAAAAVSVGASSYVATYTRYAGATSSAIGVGITAFAVVVALAAAGLGAAHLRAMADAKGGAEGGAEGSAGGSVVLNPVVSARF